MDVQPKFVPKFRLALLLGLLSIFYGEVYAGSSFLWMFDAWGLLITFPLYMFHSLFYLNMAQRTKRITISQLYLWGMLFALYRSPHYQSHSFLHTPALRQHGLLGASFLARESRQWNLWYLCSSGTPSCRL